MALNSQSFFAPDSIQATIATTLKIAPGLLDRSKRDIRLAYAKYEAIHDSIRQITLMASAGTWTQKVPSNDDFIEVFVSKSNYFRYYNTIFARVPNGSSIQKWLRGDSDASSSDNVWGSKKPTFDNLKVLLDDLDGDGKKSGGRKKTKGKSGKDTAKKEKRTKKSEAL